MLNSVVLYFIRADVEAKRFAEFSLMPEKNDTRLTFFNDFLNFHTKTSEI